ncbi:ricin-type beta-trefoil lectin domain protein [Streptomyces sp. V4-01]|uniref:Ricin-type beta-trefoil lectin domain protein n=1 Tax=Actinacidiphila polyblastidii TaxID=3110430 RepID=A0ABU7PGR5_9ACTN|nr:ricin-type beta-trefoil lectin domain protein [Streptomyces sp. V4-01]
MRHRHVTLLAGAALLAAAATGVVAAGGSAQATVQAGPGFPKNFAAPYVEDPVFVPAAMNAGIKYFTLAFATASGGKCSADMGVWASTVRQVRAAGGDVTVSFGGADGTDLAVACPSVAALEGQYRKIIDQLNVTRLDMDVEGQPLTDQPSVRRRNQALAALQGQYRKQGRRLDIEYTLPADPDGLTQDGLVVLRSAHEHGLDIDTVNPMTMDYGSRATDMGQKAIDAAIALNRQLGQIWGQLSDGQRWQMEGNTPMIGQNDSPGEKFTLADARSLTAFAKSKDMRELSYWVLDRDRRCTGKESNDFCSHDDGQAPYAFAIVMNDLTAVRQDPVVAPNPPAGNPPPAGHGKKAVLKGFAYKCVDAAKADSSPRTAVQLRTCDGTGGQTWTFADDGTVRVFGKCLAPVLGPLGNGTQVQLHPCDGDPSQKWHEDEAHFSPGTTDGFLIVNSRSGRCLDDTDRRPAEGNPLQMWDCFAGSNQRWHINKV